MMKVKLVTGLLAVALLSKSAVATRGSKEVETMPTTGCRAVTRRHRTRKAGTSKSALTSQQRQAALAALKSIRRLESATKTGLTYSEYMERLIDTKADVDEQMRLLPAGTLKNQFPRIIANYEMAGMAWKTVLTYSEEVPPPQQQFIQMMWDSAAQVTRQTEKML